MKGRWNGEKIKNGVLLGISLLLIVGIFFYNIIGGAGRTGDAKEPGLQKDELSQEEIPEKPLAQHEEKEGITQAEVLRLCSFLTMNAEEQKRLEVAAELEHYTGEEWYSEAVNVAVTRGYVTVEELHPGKELECIELRNLMVAVCQKEKISYARLLESLPERLRAVTEHDVVYLGEFLQIYERMLELLPQEQRKAKIVPVHILGVVSGTLLSDAYGESYDYSDCADYSMVFQGQEEPESEKTVNDYVDSTVSVLVSGTKLLYIRGESEEKVVLPNVWVIEAAGSHITAYVSGWQKEYRLVQQLESPLQETICDLTLQGGRVCALTAKTDKIQGKVLLTTSGQIELEDYGRIPVDENFRIYKVYDELAMEKTNHILVGYSITDFVIADGKICAALIKEKLKADVIRVVLHTSGYASLYHDTVKLTADRDFVVTQGDTRTTYPAGEVLEFDAEKEYEENERIKIVPVSDEGKLQLQSVKRTCGNPAYRGSIELVATADGLLVINELLLEEYLYAVLPSEMPTYYDAEALKAQAVCARSYAYNQLMASRYREYGAHVDDSVNCQVYNNVAEDEASIQAVKETYGMVAAYEGKVVTAYYFSTSCGRTASYEEVWEGAEPIAYLTGNLQNDARERQSMKEEEKFREFITATDVHTYESDFSWYRWKVTLPAEQVAAAAGLKKLQSIAVTERGESGIATKVTVAGTKSNGEAVEKTIDYQMAIRKLLAPKKQEVIRQDGASAGTMSLLPSAFFVMDVSEKNGEVTEIALSGGGYGHGTGMSQNGAQGMAGAGKNYEEIIGHYYEGVELLFLY